MELPDPGRRGLWKQGNRAEAGSVNPGSRRECAVSPAGVQAQAGGSPGVGGAWAERGGGRSAGRPAEEESQRSIEGSAEGLQEEEGDEEQERGWGEDAGSWVPQGVMLRPVPEAPGDAALDVEERGGARGEPGAVELPAQALSFSGSGFLVTYHIGVAQCLLENAPEVVLGARRVFGASAGSLIAAAIVCGVDLDHFYRSVTRAAKQSKRHFLGPMNPFFNPLQLVRDSLAETLHENAYQLACGRLFISMTRASDRQNILVSDFSSNEELIQALLCSCFIPIYCGLLCPTFRGVYIDGGLTNNLPLYDKNTITISPFTAEVDICPRVFADCCFCSFANCSYALIPENMHRVVRALFPPSSKVLHRFLRNGYRDTLLHLLANNMLTLDRPVIAKILSQRYCERSLQCLSLNLCLQLEEGSNAGSLEGRSSWHEAWIPKALWSLSMKKTSILDICRLAFHPMQRIRRWFLHISSAVGLIVKHEDCGTTESQSTFGIEGGCSSHQTSTGSI